ncbi:hypothetical protein COEREDRAFT_46427 [Coemansia reversa NRRL 1564]|uniref:E3 ubiquitin-protein ligase n=1 Tax=Coemansia reversa (strain ATCC 12441 / NRRL 1564) TaxID=763665 RepID=A0A2G5B6S6_COERN|nr:hypothetical protein COEREDRAFT_46427 [Coemansia reversa NRRL 1564]|eukprot:PIA14708.1 hypothetical protein COEREDRAFT_46427 [Coemansia reversa NRRL 1564]
MSPEIEEALGKPKPGAQPSESYIDQPYSGELYGYLRGTPSKYNYVLTPAARKDILRRVSWYLLSKDERLAELVPLDEKTGGAPREELQDELEVPIEYTEVRRGQPCGHVFKRGEGVYRCKNCSMDETCVLCTRCFQGTDHTGHDTSFSVNSGTGGCCDCGDPEAWKIPLRCRHHNSFEELEEVGLEPIVSSAGAPYVPGYNNNECPTSVKRSIELTIAVVLEFILETFATSPISLSAQFDEASIMEDAKNASLAIGDHEQQQKYAVVLWNDEVHSYQDVIDQCTEALQCSQMEAKKIAETVDTCGRDVLRVSASIPELIDIATTMVNVSLSVSIRAARDIFREQLSASLLIWLRDMACCKFRPLARVFQGKVNNEIRSEISYQLYAVIRHVLRGCGQQRLDWFLIFDLQLWKEVRSGLRELYMATLMLDNHFKMKIALTFARNYPRLSRAFLTQDRAPEHSVLLYSVQLFTAPTLSSSLVEHHHFMYIIMDVLKKFFMQPTPEFLRRYGVILCDTESFRNRRYFHVFHDMRYLVGTPQVQNWVSSKHHLLSAYLSFIGLFQGMNPNCRALFQHVEFEADTWVNAFNVTLQVAKSCRQLAECYGISARDLFFALRGTLRMHGYLTQNINVGDTSEASQLSFEMHTLPTLWGKQYEVVRYDISTNPVSFHHPLHWFMAQLLQHVKHFSDDRAQEFGFASMRDMVFSAAMDMIPAQRQVLRILDYPIRVCVVMAQIRAGLWVRNGYVIRLQSHHYREVSLRENTYDQDVVLIQFFISIWPDTDHILMTLLDRFGLYDWFSGRPHVSRIYEPMHMQYMVEEFLNVLIVLVSERHVATGKNTLDMARREIVHGCLSSISYSELAKKIPERLAENTEFDILLQQMADFRGPTGIMDFGQYELKDEYLDEVDPYFIHYSRNQREEIEEVLHERLRKRMRKNTNGASDVVDYSPPKLETIRFGPFQRIGMVLHTPLACQVLFYALLHATHTSGDLLSETMVDEALHLIVIALEDGQHGAPEMKQWKNKLEYIYQLFRKGGPRIVSCIDDYYANLEATPMGSRVLKSAAEEAKAAERKKQAAKARQAAIMAEFASQQQSFMSQYGDDTCDKGKGVDAQRVHQPLWSAPCGACILCQEECDGSRPYGSLALIQANRAIRTAPLSDAAHVIDILRLPSELDSSTDQLRAMNQIAHGAYGATSGLKGFPVMYHQRGMVASTCGHLMHMRCFMQYCQGIEAKRQQQPTRNHPENPHRKEYLCPLCKSLGNVLLPALPDIAEYDPLAVADSDPSRFKSQASQTPSYQNDGVRDREHAGASAAAAQNSAGSFPFSFTDGLTDSIPRLDDLIRGAQRLPSGLGIHTLLSRFLPQLAGSALGIAPGSERLTIPLSRLVHWLVSRQVADSGPHQHRKHTADAGSHVSTPDIAGSMPGVQAPAEVDLRLHEQLEAYQYINPPVFDHEDSRTLPSGTFSDGVPESLAIFMHSLSKISELQYRSVLGPISDIRRSNMNVTDAQAVQTTPAEQLHALIAESHQQLTSSSVLHVPTAASMQGDILARTRLEMLKDLECSLAPLTGSQHVCSRESLCEQSLWLSGSESTSEPECARLLKLLNLPSIHHLFDPVQQPGMLQLVEGWLSELRMFRRRHTSPMSLGAGCTMAVPVAMPTLYSLVDLPDRFEILFERSAKSFCPRCNGVPSDPALCLLCGSFVCAQSFCCEEDGVGECNMHMKTCGGTVGVYLLVKKCGLLLLHHDNGCFMSAPYLDQHGEVDLGLKRGRPLFINNTRYEEMRRLVLTQKIPVFIARKIDQAFDIGGWVSL